MTRLPWCLAAGWGVVALLRFASAPRDARRTGEAARRRTWPSRSPAPERSRPLSPADAPLRGVVHAPGVLHGSRGAHNTRKRLVHRADRCPRIPARAPARRPGGSVARDDRPRAPPPTCSCAATPCATGWSDDELARLVRAGELDAGCAAAPMSTAAATAGAGPAPAADPRDPGGPAPARRGQPPVGGRAARLPAVGRAASTRCTSPAVRRPGATRAARCAAMWRGCGTTT